MLTSSAFSGVDFIALNTDAQALSLVETPNRVQIGTRLTHGLGAGGDPSVGQRAVEESSDEVEEHLRDADMVFVTCGMGGGTGTGAAPLVAEMAKRSGALTVGVVTKPFLFEGKRRQEQAQLGIARMLDAVDTLIVISNDRLLKSLKAGLALKNAFKAVDEILLHGIQGISDIIMIPGLINVDFADVRAVMGDAGVGVMGLGYGNGEHPAVVGVRNAVENQLLDYSIEGATRVIFNVTSSQNLPLFEINQAAEAIYQAVHPDANVIFGTVIDDKMEETVKVTLIAIIGKQLPVSVK
jgi:cell division protein FtsZ